MLKQVIIFKGFWTFKDVQENPTSLFIFGDNDVSKGKGGQAVIRDEPNALGIPTKKLPNMHQNSFYQDSELKDNKEKINISIHKILKEVMKHNYKYIVFPEGGLGTGLSKLPEKAPLTYQYLDNKINALKVLFSN